MDVDAFLADSVVSAEGKLYVQGAGWNIIYAQNLPTQHDRIGIGALIHVPYTATNQQHTFGLHLEDADGQLLPFGNAPPEANLPDNKIREFGSSFNVGRPPGIQPGDEQLVAMALNINGLPFEKGGTFTFVISIDGTPVKRLPFRVVQVPQPAPLMK